MCRCALLALQLCFPDHFAFMPPRIPQHDMFAIVIKLECAALGAALGARVMRCMISVSHCTAPCLPEDTVQCSRIGASCIIFWHKAPNQGTPGNHVVYHPLMPVSIDAAVCNQVHTLPFAKGFIRGNFQESDIVNAAVEPQSAPVETVPEAGYVCPSYFTTVLAFAVFRSHMRSACILHDCLDDDIDAISALCLQACCHSQ